MLEFPATAPRQPTAASSRQLPPPQGSLLAAEPAYRSALSHLRAGNRPGTAPATVSTSLPLAAPPGSRLDALLASRPGTAVAAAPPTIARPVSSRLDALLSSSQQVAAPPTARQPPPAAAPSSRLDELLASRPLPATSSTKSALPSTRLDQLLSARPPLRPATKNVAAPRHSTGGAASGHGRQPQAAAPLPGGHAAAPAALSPVEEEPASASRTDRSALSGAGNRDPASWGAAGAGARGGHAAAAAVAAAEARPRAVGMPDPALQDRLRERIELAKVGACSHLIALPSQAGCATAPGTVSLALTPAWWQADSRAAALMLRRSAPACPPGCPAGPDPAAAEPHVPPLRGAAGGRAGPAARR